MNNISSDYASWVIFYCKYKLNVPILKAGMMEPGMTTEKLTFLQS